MHVRPGRPEDVDAVVALVAEVDRERGDVLDEEAFRSLLAQAALFVAEADGDVVGNLGVHGVGGSSASLGMSVARTWRRRGVGTALLEAAVAWAVEQGLERLTLEVLADNEPAVALYRKTGFVEQGRRRAAGHEIVLMCRRLGSVG